MAKKAETPEPVYGKCQSCEEWGPVNDISLCSECNGKIQRDFIRLRDWDYVVAAFTLPPDKREELRQKVIERYGEKLELIEG